MKYRSFIYSAEDKELFRKICKDCGSKRIKHSYGFMERLVFLRPNQCFIDFFDDVAFFCGVICKDHLRCVDIAVLAEYQRQGIGKEIIFFETHKASMQGANRMTLRTPFNEDGIKFWLSIGAQITGKGESYWDMTLPF